MNIVDFYGNLESAMKKYPNDWDEPPYNNEQLAAIQDVEKLLDEWDTDELMAMICIASLLKKYARSCIDNSVRRFAIDAIITTLENSEEMK